MKKIELNPIREWEEKDGKRLTGGIRLYIGNLHIGTCHPRKNLDGDIQKYDFISMMPDVTYHMSTKKKTMEEIKTEVEVSFKELGAKVFKTIRTLTPLKQKQ